jgi:hypothetical protein
MFFTHAAKSCGETKENTKLRSLKNPEVTCSADNRSSLSNTISITTDICQLCKKEDVVPAFQKTDTHVAMLVGDGHSGSTAAETLSQNSGQILKTVLKSGVDAGMQMCIELCQSTHSGAMVVISLYSIFERKLEIISMGDASCTVYQEGQMIHEQPHHSRQTVDADKGTCESTSGNQITWKEKAVELGIIMRPEKFGCMDPQPDGRTMLVDKRPEYFNWSSGAQFAGCSFVGHTDIVRVPPCKIVIPRIADGPFHLVMTSDGVSDVVHPEDSLLKDHAVNASDIVNEAKKRWTTPFFNPTEQEDYLSNNDLDLETSKLYFVVNPFKTMKSTSARWKAGGAFYPCKSYTKKDDGTYDVKFNDGDTRKSIPAEQMKFVEYNKGADDISVLVMTVE